MSRIRTIKPEFSQSETVGTLSRDARLLFIQLWPICDDTGRARGADRYLAGQLYPYDDDAPGEIGGWLDELQSKGFIRRYEVEGTKYLDIPTWSRHQRVDNAAKSRIPEFNGEVAAKHIEPLQEIEVSREPPRTAEDCGEPPPVAARTLDLVPRKVDSRRVAVATAVAFEEFWKVYPKREGDNPKKPAAKKFLTLTLSGVDPLSIVESAKRYAANCEKRKDVGTRYVAQAVTWLNQERFSDYSAVPAETKIAKPRHGQILGPEFGERAAGRTFVLAETAEWDAWCSHIRGLGKPAPPRYFHEGWAFATLWPPGYEPQSEAAE